VYGAGAAVGEVIAVSTTGFEAQSYLLNEAPPFGSLVLCNGPDGLCHYGLCSAVATSGIEPGRHAIAWGRAEDGDEDIYARQPQLAHVLRTTFEALLIGFVPAGGDPVQRIPPRPPRVHERVYQAGDAQIRAFFADLSYLRFVLRSGMEHTEDLLAASIATAYQARGRDRRFLVDAGRAVAHLLAGDHERLVGVLELLARLEESAGP
jgi:hypothetical protein